MQLAEYSVKALEFALDSIKGDQLYACLGLVSEIGEVADKIKKQLRDKAGAVDDEFTQALALELGDCMWYLNLMATNAGININDSSMHQEYGDKLEVNCKYLAQNILSAAGSLDFEGMTYTTPEVVDNVFMSLSEICIFINISLTEVMQRNINKLSSRQSRGAIGGAGDNR